MCGACGSCAARASSSAASIVTRRPPTVSVTGPGSIRSRRRSARLRYVYGGSAVFALSCLGAATAPTLPLFALWLVPCGLSSLTIMTTANAYVQSTTSPVMRGRVMSLYMAIFMGGTPIGARLIGWVANAYGPRWAMLVGAASGALAAGVGLGWYLRTRRRARAGEPAAQEEVALVTTPALTPRA